MPKLAIYVPKAEMKKIDRWRKKINFSRIFMKALAKEIGDQTRTIKAGDNQVSAAAAFYRKELARNSGKIVDFGFEMGSRDVLECRLKPELIHNIIDANEFDAQHEGLLELAAQCTAGSKAEIEKYEQENSLQEHPTWKTSMFEGYFQGVKVAWKQVCDAMHGA